MAEGAELSGVFNPENTELLEISPEKDENQPVETRLEHLARIYDIAVEQHKNLDASNASLDAKAWQIFAVAGAVAAFIIRDGLSGQVHFIWPLLAGVAYALVLIGVAGVIWPRRFSLILQNDQRLPLIVTHFVNETREIHYYKLLARLLGNELTTTSGVEISRGMLEQLSTVNNTKSRFLTVAIFALAGFIFSLALMVGTMTPPQSIGQQGMASATPASTVQSTPSLVPFPLSPTP